MDEKLQRRGKAGKVIPLRVRDEDAWAAALARHAAAELVEAAELLSSGRLDIDAAESFGSFVRRVHAASAGVDPEREPQARGFLVELVAAGAAIEASGDATDIPGPIPADAAKLEELVRLADGVELSDDDARTLADAFISVRAQWVIDAFGDYFPRYAAKLRTDEKRAQIGAVLRAWFATEQRLRIGKGRGKWTALVEVGRGVFTTNNRKRWERDAQCWRAGTLRARGLAPRK